jgi:hypothetical protein
MRGRIAVLVVACVAVLGVAGCGGDDDETTTTTTTTEPAVTGATGAEGGDEGLPEGTGDVEALLEQSFAASGLSEGEAACVADVVAPEVSDKPVTELQDPSYVEGLLQDQKSAIEDCEGQ